jgi:hypothetical protein
MPDSRELTTIADSAARWRLVGFAAGAYFATSFIILISASGVDFRRTGRIASGAYDSESFRQPWSFGGDGYHFVAIARDGYSYDAKSRSQVAFFPVFPLTGRAIAEVTCLTIEKGLVLAAHGYLLGAFVLLGLYAFQRYGEATTNIATYALLAFGLFPPTFFFRMNYSEPSFLFFGILAMLAMEQQWSPVATAFVVGLATATRPVGVALVPVFCMYLWQRSVGWREFAFRSVLLLPLSLWGLIGYMCYQYAAFGQPLAFALTQEHWGFRQPVSFDEKVLAILSHEPIWSVYDPSSEAYWQRTQPEPHGWSNLALANPIYSLLAVGLVVLGAWKRWLNKNEMVLAALLILIPYLTRGFEMCMLSQGRFIAVVFPIYLVMGHLLSRCSAPCAALLLCFSAVVMAIYAAQFAAGYMLI